MVRQILTVAVFVLLVGALLISISVPDMDDIDRSLAPASMTVVVNGRQPGIGTGSNLGFHDKAALNEPLRQQAPSMPDMLSNHFQAKASNHPERQAPWSTDQLLADPTHMNDQYLSLVCDPATNHLYAAFEAYDLGGTDRDIHIARSTDGGQTWTQHEMPSTSLDESQPDLALDDAGYLHLVWVRSDGMLVRARSAGPGSIDTWAFVHAFEVGEPVAVPSIAVAGSGDFATVFIACSWYTVNWDWYQYEYTLLWLYSTNGGNTVSYDYLQPDGYQDLWPDVALSDGTVSMINGEQDAETGRIRILVASDAVSGTFADYVDLTETSGMSHGFPSLVGDGDKIYMAWQLDWDNGLGELDGDVMYAFSWDGLATVNGPYAIMATESESVGPRLYTRDGVVGCIWLEAPTNGDEFSLAAAQASLDGHPDFWGEPEVASDQPTVVPQFRSVAGCVASGSLRAAWIDRRDFNTQGFNVYTCDRGLLPDLAPFTPDGWSSPLVVSMTAGDRDDSILAAGFPAYASLALVNLGLADATVPVETELWLDDDLVGSWVMASGLPQATFSTAEDVSLDLTAGAHTLTLRLDPANRVDESDESDNVLIKDLWVVSGEPEIAISPASLHFVADAPDPTPPTRIPAGFKTMMAPRLAAAMTRAGETERFRIVVSPAERLNPAALEELSRHAAVAALKEEAQRVAQTLASRVDTPLRSLWLSGDLVGELTPAEIQDLATSPSVGHLWLDDRKSELLGDLATPILGHVSLNEPIRSTWPLELLGVPAAWAQGLDGSGVLVGHTDSGVAWDHPDLVGHLWDGGSEFPHHGYDFLDEDNDPYDPGVGNFWHGTHTAGLIVSSSYGAAPGARLLATRCVPGYYEDLVQALQFCLDQGCHLISSSAGWTDADEALRSANRGNAEVLLSVGIPWIVAAGNGDNAGGHLPAPRDISSPGDSPDPWFGTAGHSAVISVGAVTQASQTWSSSSLGPADWSVSNDTGHDDYPYPPGLTKPDVAAPGADIASTIGNGGYDIYSGTSMATPLVAGCVAIMLQASPGLGCLELAEALETTCEDLGTLGRDNQSGAGLVDLPAALAVLPTSQATFVQARNLGAVPLVITDISANVPWLSVTPSSGTVVPGDSLRVAVAWDAGGLNGGAHFGQVTFLSNDPSGSVDLPVSLAVGMVSNAEALPRSLVGSVTCYPNPFNPRTVLQFETLADGPVSLELYDPRGRLVRRLLSETRERGVQRIPWDGCDDRGAPCAAGVYLARVQAGGEVNTGRMLLVK